MRDNKTIAIIGTGYVGLIYGGALSHLGKSVICVESNQTIVENLKSFNMHVYEPKLKKMIINGVKKSKLKFTNNIKDALNGSDIIFITVGTPSKDSGECDISAVQKVIDDIATMSTDDKLVIIKSTVEVGTTRKMKNYIDEKLAKLSKNICINIVFSPEFLSQGNAVRCFFNPNKIVMGCDNKEIMKVLTDEVYEYFKEKKTPIIYTNYESAELIKYACNAFLAMKVSYINLISQLCGKYGANIDDVKFVMGLDKRIGNKFLNAGLGFGGSCFQKDTKALIEVCKKNNISSKFIESVLEINDEQLDYLERIIVDVLGEKENINIAVLGIAFKPNTNDTRESPSIKLIKKLITKGYNIHIHDPVVDAKKLDFFFNVKFYDDVYECVHNTTAIVIATEWDEYKKLNLEIVSKLVNEKNIFDFRNIYDPEEIRDYGFKYFGVGRGQ